MTEMINDERLYDIVGRLNPEQKDVLIDMLLKQYEHTIGLAEFNKFLEGLEAFADGTATIGIG